MLSTRPSKCGCRCSGELGVESSHFRFYGRHAVVAEHGDSMVAVHHEVDLANLVELHRRQVLSPVKCPAYALPLLPDACPRGQEGAVEVAAPPHAADDLVCLYYPRPSVGAVVDHEPPSSDVVEAEQPVGGALLSPSNAGHRRSQASPAHGTGEIRVHLLV